MLKFAEQAKIQKRVVENGIVCDAREYGIRLSPHIYTSEEEIEQLIPLLCLA